MPRDGLQQYAPPPGTNGITNYTIESTKYNGFVADVTQDLNLPRPIVAGGTGSTTPADARLALGVEVSSVNQIVTNYDSQIWQSGSFVSFAGATSAPNAIDHFSGVAVPLTGDQSYITIRAVSFTTGVTYTKLKVAGVWGSWLQGVGSLADADSRYVNATGDYMTGALQINADNTGVILNKTGATANVTITGAKNSLPRWIVELGNTVAESGGNSGSHFGINRCNDAGGIIDTPLTISRSNGNAGFTGTVSTTQNFVAGSASTTGGYYFGNTGTKSLNYDGTTFNLVGGPLLVSGNNITARDYTATRGDGTGVYYFSDTTHYLQWDGAKYNLAGGPLATVTSLGTVTVGTSPLPPTSAILNISFNNTTQAAGLAIRTAVDSAYAAAFYNASGANVGGIITAAAATSFATSSDDRLKEDLKSFDAGNIIDGTNVYDFAWKSTGERTYGVIAQQANEIYPTAVAYKKDEDWWGIDYSKYVPVLLQELKALRQRVAQLEGRLDAKPA